LRAVSLREPLSWNILRSGTGTSSEEFSRRWRSSPATSQISAASWYGTGSRTSIDVRFPFEDWRNRARIHGSAGHLGTHNPENTVNVIYVTDSDRTRRRPRRNDPRGYGFLPVFSSFAFETYSLFYRSRKDVRQLKDSLDLLCGRAARRHDGSRMVVVALVVAMAGVWVDGSSKDGEQLPT